MLKISWTEHKTNDKVLELAEEQRALMTTLRQRQKKNGWDMCYTMTDY